MAINLTTWSDADLATLRDLVQRERNRRLNAPVRTPVVANTDQAPEVYIAKVPDAGIAASVSGVPGTATCTIYQLISGTLYLLSLTETVYNVSDSDIPTGAVLVIRDKFGTWVAAAGGGGSSPVVPSTAMNYSDGHRVLMTEGVWCDIGDIACTVPFKVTLPAPGMYLVSAQISGDFYIRMDQSTQRIILGVWNSGSIVPESNQILPMYRFTISDASLWNFVSHGSLTFIKSFAGPDLDLALRLKVNFIDTFDGATIDLFNMRISFMEIISNTGTGGSDLITEALTAVAGGTVNDVLTIGPGGLLSSMSGAALGDSMGGITGTYGDD